MRTIKDVLKIILKNIHCYSGICTCAFYMERKYEIKKSEWVMIDSFIK